MESKPSPLVSYSDFPDHLATDEYKSTKEYGLKVGRAIQYEWFQKKGGSCRFYDQHSNFHQLRLYARGEQDIQQYKDQIAINGDLSNLNLDWKPVPIIPKFVDIIVNGMADREFTPKATAEDITSAQKRNSYQETIEHDMQAKDFLMQTRNQFGIDAFNVDPSNLPNNDKELELHMQIEYKPGIEIAEETAISTIFGMNDFYDIKDRYNYDVTVLGIGMVKHRYSYNEGIKIEYVDPQNVVYSYTEDPEFNDIFYVGEVKQIPILELKKINPNLTDEDIERISKLSGAWGDEYSIARPYNDGLFQKDICNVLYYSYKTDKK
jgi:hypothetical protein